MATNLVAGDGNGASDVFRKDLTTGDIMLISKTSTGISGSARSLEPDISSDGNYISFWGDAGNLVPGDTTGRDAFLFNVIADTMIELSRDSNNAQSTSGSAYTPGLTHDGVWAVFHGSIIFSGIADTNGQEDIYLKNAQTLSIVRASVSQAGVQSNGRSHNAQFSEDNRYMSFNSRATNLIDGEAMPGVFHQTLVKDLQTNEILCVSRAENGDFANADSDESTISSDGNSLVFTSSATNLGKSADSNGLSDIYLYKIR